jgi:iron complex outermembrane recepter protein
MKNPDSNMNCDAAPAFRRTRLSMTIAAAIAALASAQVHAQADAPAPPSSAASAAAPPALANESEAKEAASQVVETITITATRRREPTRDVPMQVNSLSVQQMERAGATTLSDYMSTQPGVDVKTSGGPGLGQVSIRGVTTGGQTIATVGMYIDDVAFGSNSAYAGGSGTALDMSLLDLNHIEVLRGPQGTLYGAGAMGGLLKYVTNEPDTSEFSGKVSLGVRSTRSGALSHTESAVVNVPLKEDVAGLRFAVFRDHEGGYVNAVGPAAGSHINRGNTTGGRISLLFEPTSRLKVRLTGTAQDIEREGNDVVDYDIVTGRPVDGDLRRRLGVREPYSVAIRLASLDVEYDFGWARLNSISAVQSAKTRIRLDSAFYDPVLSGLLGQPVGLAKLDSAPEVHKRTQEFRLTSGRGSVEWLAGLYLDHETGANDQLLSATLLSDGSPLDAVTASQPSTYRETALYGDVTFNFAPQWSLTTGARIARNEQSYSQVVNGAPGPTTDSSETANTYLATLRYTLTKESNIYFRAASGYRPGGPNAPALDGTGNPIPGAPTSFKSDSLWSYELGYKADVLDKRLSVEAAVYDIRWKDLQQPVAVGATTLIANAGKASVRGAELFARYRATDSWNLDGSISYIDAKLTEDAPALGAAGSRLPNSAHLSGSLGTNHTFALAGRASYAGVNLRYVGERNAGFDTAGTSQPNFKMPSYTLIDLQGGVDFGTCQLALFVRNLSDRRALLAADAALVAFGSPLRATVAQPRTFGATLTASF